MFRLSVLVALLAICGGALSHTYHLGACPVVEPMKGFDMNKMLGVWYVIQKTTTDSPCVIYNFTQADEPGKYRLEQLSQIFLITPVKHPLRYTGILTVPDSAVPAQMKVRFPLSLAGSASYTVMDTDYKTYAAIFTCQKLVLSHRRSATILSRTKELDSKNVDKMRTKLSSFGVDPSDLSIISQSDCPNGTSEGFNIDINAETFSAQNVGNLIIGKKVFRKVADGKEELAESPNMDGSPGSMDVDAEWLP